MIERVLSRSRWLVMITVVISLLSAVLLYATSIVNMIKMFMEIFYNPLVVVGEDYSKITVVRLLKMLDILLIAVTLQIIAMGLYRLFVNQNAKETAEIENVGNLRIQDFHQLKATVIHMTTVILVIIFLEKAVQQGATLDLLYFGLAVGFVIFTSVWAADKIIHTHRDD